MNRALWIAKKRQLCYLIKQVSDAYGGDDREWLREYARDIIEANKDDLGNAIGCFHSLCSGSEKKSNGEPVLSLKTSVCPDCGYVPPFCYYFYNQKCSM